MQSIHMLRLPIRKENKKEKKKMVGEQNHFVSLSNKQIEFQ